MDSKITPFPAADPADGMSTLTPRQAMLWGLFLADAARRQAEPPSKAVLLRSFIPAWDSILADVPTDALEAIGQQALRDLTTSYPLTAADVLRTWQGFAPRRAYMPSHPFLLPGERDPAQITSDPPPVALTRLLTGAVASRGWDGPPAALVATLLVAQPDPVDAAAQVAPLLRVATGWADVTAWLAAGVAA